MKFYTKYIFTLCVSLVFITIGFQFAYSQKPEEQDSKYGWQMAPYGRLHILVIYAEVNFDSTFGNLDPIAKEGHNKWRPRELPSWRDAIFSPNPEGEGYMTKYFRLASFGKFQVTGDYIDTVITINISDVKYKNGKVVTQEAFAANYYRQAVLNKINGLDSLRFAFGSKMEDFDNWTPSGAGYPKKDSANGRTDLVMLVWRNIHVANLGNHSGYVQMGNFGEVGGKLSDMYSQFRTSDYIPSIIMRHEFSHMLYGANNFHTACGGVGQRTFMSTIGGYSNMGAADSYSNTFNGWDRDRLSWKNPGNEFQISARTVDGKEVNADLTYQKHSSEDGMYVLRDFINSGDVIRIKIPHIPGDKKRQYLWLENHRLEDKEIDHGKALLPGIYAYITAGKDDKLGRQTFGGQNNYLWPLPAIGQYDFGYDVENMVLHLDSNMANPFTGFHYHMRHTMDLDGDDKIRITTDMRPKTEYILPKSLVKNGVEMPESYFSYQTYPVFGTIETSFQTYSPLNRIGISWNPSATPLYTFVAPGGPAAYDNRRIYLNGISVELLSEESNGDIRVKIRFDDFDIVRDVRWCGSIISKENINLKQGNTILIDQGYSTQEAEKIQVIGGKPVFAYPTFLQLDSGSVTKLEKNTTLILRQGSTLIVRKGAELTLEKGAKVITEAGCFIYVEEGAIIHLGKKAKFELKPGAKVGIHPLWEKELSYLQRQTALPSR